MKTDNDLLWLHLRDLPYFRAMLRAVEARFYQDYDLPSPTLDVGCGDGHFAHVTFKRPVDIGLDPDAASLKQARRWGGYRWLVQADGGRMPFPDAYFASAISNSVLEHIPHVQRVLAETGRVLRPGARFIFSVPNPRYLSELSIPAWLSKVGLHSLGEVYRAWFGRMSRVFHAHWPEVWVEWLHQAGFQVERYWHYFSPPALRMLEWGHYFGAPTLLPHALAGRWILFPSRWNLAITERLVRPFAQALEHPQGTFTFYLARRSASEGS